MSPKGVGPAVNIIESQTKQNKPCQGLTARTVQQHNSPVYKYKSGLMFGKKAHILISINSLSSIKYYRTISENYGFFSDLSLSINIYYKLYIIYVWVCVWT